MKVNIIILALLFGFALQANAQKSYAEKANQRRTTGYILLAGGAAMITVALVSDLSDDSPVWLTAGGISALASVPFFVSASKNKRRAGIISGLLEVQRFSTAMASPPGGGIPAGVVPALKLKISL